MNTEYLPALYTLISSRKTYRPGDAVKVEISEVSVADRRIELKEI